MNDRYDFVVVGGGSAGCVLASRLSEDRAAGVLLIEAGPSFEPSAYPGEFTNGSAAAMEPYCTWGFTSVPGRTGHVIAAYAGRVLGGGSAINGGISRRARPADFDRWVAHGLPEWSFDRVLGTFKSLENTPDGEDRWHGRDGPWPIRQSQPEQLTPTVRAFIASAAGLGFPGVTDFNDPNQHGVGGEPKNVVDGLRQNTGMVYLTDEVRARSNLMISANTAVDRIVFEGRRARSVTMSNGQIVEAGEIVVAAGVYGSPAILLRSGIGPRDHLQAHSIDLVADLPVGEHLRDQPMYVLNYLLRSEVDVGSSEGSGVLWTSSSEAVDGELDLQLSISMQPDLDARGSWMQTLSVWGSVMTPRSTGKLRLKSRDPRVSPYIDYDLLAADTDRRRLREIVKLARTIVRSEPVASFVLDERAPGSHVRTDDALDAAIATGLVTFLHGTSTVPMGGPGNPAAVVDGRGRVSGIDGLRVADASIFPEPVSAPVNLTTLMVAERIAVFMRDSVG